MLSRPIPRRPIGRPGQRVKPSQLHDDSNMAPGSCSLHKSLCTDESLRKQHRYTTITAECQADGCFRHITDFMRTINAIKDEADGGEQAGRGLSHRNLPGIELTEFASHRDECEQRQLARLDQ